MRDIAAHRYYTDSASSIVDPVLKRRNELAVKPFEDYLRGASRITDEYMRSADGKAAACALEWLDAWAQGKAMLGSMTGNQSEYQRKWMLAGLALGYLKIREDVGLDPARKRRVEAWLREMAQAVRPFFDNPRRTRNNHLYWVGLAVTAAGVAADDRALFDWGVGVYREALAQITPQGTLPLEMARGKRALHYHSFALAPLVMIAEIGSVNGIALYEEAGGALHRLVASTAGGIVDSSLFERMAGSAMEPPPRGGELAWVEPYLARFPDAALPRAAIQRIMQARPLVYTRLGGNLTTLYAGRGTPAQAGSAMQGPALKLP